jgi:hypothetical protein
MNKISIAAAAMLAAASLGAPVLAWSQSPASPGAAAGRGSPRPQRDASGLGPLGEEFFTTASLY